MKDFWCIFQIEQNLAVDKSMIPYYGRYSAEQFLRNKPIKFGQKSWCLCTRLAYLVQMDPSGKLHNHPDLGLQGSVLMKLYPVPPKNCHFHLIFDNLFTSLYQVGYFESQKFGATGILYASRERKIFLLWTKKKWRSK